MRRFLFAVVLTTVSWSAADAQMTGRRAWQQRLLVEVPSPQQYSTTVEPHWKPPVVQRVSLHPTGVSPSPSPQQKRWPGLPL